MGWIANMDYLYIFNSLNAKIFDTLLLPESNAIWPSLISHTFYKNYFFYANQGLLAVYKADTLLPPADTTYSFNFYPYYNSGNLYFYISLPYGDVISLRIFDLSGRLRAEFLSGFLDKGEHRIFLNKRLKKGVYVVILEGSKFNKKQKILYIK